MADSAITVIRVGKLFDGTGRAPIERATIVIEGGEIAAIGAEDATQTPPGRDVTVLDFPDATAIPGLVDAHTHLVLPGDNTLPETMMEHNDGVLLLQAAANARRALMTGVTTMADMGARNRVSFTLREAIGLGLAVGPRLVLCGRPVTRTGGHGWYFNEEADGPESIRRSVRQLLKEGADVIKVMATGGGSLGTDPFRATYLLDELQAATGEAHGAGKKAAAHCSATEGMARALAAGFDMIFHAHFYEPGGQLRFQPELARRLADSGTYVNPTLEVARSRVETLRAKQDKLTPQERQELQLRATKYAGRVENVSKLVQHGVKMIAGSDAGWGPNPFGDFVKELEAMVTVGMTPFDVLLAATRNSADALGFGHQVGTLEKGKKADILVAGGDPLQDVGSLRKLKAMFLDGKPVELEQSGNTR